VLGITTYQEALRALGGLARPEDAVRIREHPSRALVELSESDHSRLIGANELEQIVVASRARRGANPGVATASAISDVLRSVGLALDEMHALQVTVELSPAGLRVDYIEPTGRPGELTYAADELIALRNAAAARRKGDPLSRILILHADADAAAPLREVLVAEFAVQSLPTVYARAVAEASEPPDAILAHTGHVPDALLEAVRLLRAAPKTADVPTVVLAAVDAGLDPSAAFAVGADDLLLEPVQPALLRARLRTWLLRRKRAS
jgi:CheY-like chemotaxis protein